MSDLSFTPMMHPTPRHWYIGQIGSLIDGIIISAGEHCIRSRDSAAKGSAHMYEGTQKCGRANIPRHERMYRKNSNKRSLCYVVRNFLLGKRGEKYTKNLPREPKKKKKTPDLTERGKSNVLAQGSFIRVLTV